jgi:hypothetical protein
MEDKYVHHKSISIYIASSYSGGLIAALHRQIMDSLRLFTCLVMIVSCA